MNGEGCVFSKNSPVASSAMEGAKGRNISRCLMRRFRISFISARRGSARILRLPSARGPHSVAPWNQPTIFPAAMRRAVASSSGLFVECLDPNTLLPQTKSIDGSADFICGERRPPVRVVHCEFAGPPQNIMVDSKCRADRQTRIPCRRLYEDALEGRVIEDLSVGDAVKRDAAGEAKSFLSWSSCRASSSAQ